MVNITTAKREADTNDRDLGQKEVIKSTSEEKEVGKLRGLVKTILSKFSSSPKQSDEVKNAEDVEHKTEPRSSVNFKDLGWDDYVHIETEDGTKAVFKVFFRKSIQRPEHKKDKRYSTLGGGKEVLTEEEIKNEKYPVFLNIETKVGDKVRINGESKIITKITVTNDVGKDFKRKEAESAAKAKMKQEGEAPKDQAAV